MKCRYSRRVKLTLGTGVGTSAHLERLLVFPTIHHRFAAESTAAPPAGSSHPTPRKCTLNNNYWPAFPSSFEIPALERSRIRICVPSPPTKVVKVKWGIRSTSTDSEPSLKAIWLGHAVRSQVAPSRFTLIPCSHTSGDSSSSFRVSRSAHRTNPLVSCSTPSLTVRRPVSLGGHSTPPASLRSSGTTRIPIRGLLS